jgi:hypothetical protein
VIAAALLAPSGGALAAANTTAPSKRVTVLVQINDKAMKLTKFIGSSDAAQAELEVMPGPVPRGDYLSINIVNEGKKAHDFTILGKKTPRIRPGQRAHLFLTLLRRGNVLYRSTLDNGPSFRGYITVY